MSHMRARIQALVLLGFLAASSSLLAQTPLRLQEAYAPGYEYHVSSRVDLTGTLSLPPEKGKGPGSLTVTGTSAIEYDERVLTRAQDGRVGKTVRIYRRVDFQRKVGTEPQESTIRPAVRRLVLLRLAQAEVPFSPDGPLTWGEIDQVRTDVFTPALAGMLPLGAVRPGDRWTAGQEAVQELTDLERIEQGSVGCKFEQVVTISGRQHARISFSGSVAGVGEDGRSRHQMEGYFFFDLESNHLSYLSLAGVQQMLDKDGKMVGKVEGNFVLTRRPQPRVRELSDESLRGLALEPNDDNTQLLYDNPDLGIRLLHPRRWRVAGVRGKQLALDERGGSGMMLTLDTLKGTPTTAAYYQEVQAWLRQQKATTQAAEQPRVLQGPPQALDRFGVDVTLNRERVVLTYFVLRQAAGGVTVVARLLPADLGSLVREADRIVRSVQLTKPQ